MKGRLMTALSTLRDRLTGPGMGALGALAAAAVALGTGTGVLQWQAHTHAREDAARAESLQAARDTTAAILSYTADSVDKDLAARTGGRHALPGRRARADGDGRRRSCGHRCRHAAVHDLPHQGARCRAAF